MLIYILSDGHGSQVPYQRLSAPDLVLRNCQRDRKQPRYAKVRTQSVSLRSIGDIRTITNCSHSSVVLWVSQNMEDDYTYNLAL